MKRFIYMCLAMLTLSMGVASAQGTKAYSGVVQDTNGVPLIGVTVYSPDSGAGTITDTDGKYKLDIKQGIKLQYSYMGYKTQTVTTGTVTSINIQMELENQLIDDVIVTGYGTQKRSDISTAVASVNIKELKNSSSAQVLEALQGQVSGVQIISDDGSPSGGVTFRIRGTNSLTGGTQPLFVIDGVPQAIVESASGEDANPLEGLNMNDIETMEILKDAAAASIYGADGSNGVVLITTKQGQKGKAKVSISANMGLTYTPQISGMDVLSPQEYIERKAYLKPDTEQWQTALADEVWNDPSMHTNWLDAITRVAKRYEATASVSGGGDNTTYMLSMGYLKNQGILFNNEFDRLSARLNLNQKLGKKGNLTAIFNYSNTVEKNPQQDGLYLKAYYTNPYLMTLNSDDEENDASDQTSLNTQNPLYNMLDSNVKKDNNNLNAQFRYTYDIMKGLKFTTSIAGTKSINDYYQVLGSSTWLGKNNNGYMKVTNDDNFNWVYMAQLQYNKKIKDHSFSVFGAFEAKENNRDYQEILASNFSDLSLMQYSLATAQTVDTPKYTYSKVATLSTLGRATYNYKDKYVANASVRRDGSSKFGTNNKYAIFPSASFAWRMDQEEWMKGFENISSIKVRASYGVTGNNQIPSYLTTSYISYDKVGMGSDGSYTSATTTLIDNDDLKWETSREINTGIDVSLFNNKLSLTADYYNKEISDMLLETQVPESSGYSSVWQNAGRMRNSGFEFSINARPVTLRNFSWASNFNIAFNKNEVLELGDGQYEQYYTTGGVDNCVLLRVGMSTGIYYGYVEDGVYNTQEEVDNSPEDANKALGRTRLVDTNGDGSITEDDRVPIANVTPTFTGGWGNTFTYKNLELYAFMRFSVGNDQINLNKMTLGNVGAGQNNVLRSAWYASWTPENPENNYHTGTETNDPYQSYLTTRYVEDGSFLRLSTLRLSYNVPQKYLRKIKLSTLRLGVTGSNLWLWTSYSGLDPEANKSSGTAKNIAPALDNSSIPKATSVLFSIDLGF